MNRFFVLLLLLFSLAAQAQREEDKYAEVSWPTPNIAADTINELQGIVLHHTAVPTVLRSLMTLTDKRRGVGAHCVIDTDGTRYILCPPYRRHLPCRSVLSPWARVVQLLHRRCRVSR